MTSKGTNAAENLQDLCSTSLHFIVPSLDIGPHFSLFLGKGAQIPPAFETVESLAAEDPEAYLVHTFEGPMFRLNNLPSALNSAGLSLVEFKGKIEAADTFIELEDLFATASLRSTLRGSGSQFYIPLLYTIVNKVRALPSFDSLGQAFNSRSSSMFLLSGEPQNELGARGLIIVPSPYKYFGISEQSRCLDSLLSGVTLSDLNLAKRGPLGDSFMVFDAQKIPGKLFENFTSIFIPSEQHGLTLKTLELWLNKTKVDESLSPLAGSYFDPLKQKDVSDIFASMLLRASDSLAALS